MTFLHEGSRVDFSVYFSYIWFYSDIKFFTLTFFIVYRESINLTNSMVFGTVDLIGVTVVFVLI